MQIAKQRVLELLLSRGQQTSLYEADDDLPDPVDTEQHADLLAELGIDPADLSDDSDGAGGSMGGVLSS